MLHLASGTGGDQIETNTILAAVELVEYFLAHALALFDPSSGTPPTPSPS